MGLGMIVADLLEFQGVLFGIWRSSQECSFGFMFHLSLLYSTGVIFIFLDKLVPICVTPRVRSTITRELAHRSWLWMLQLASRKIFTWLRA